MENSDETLAFVRELRIAVSRGPVFLDVGAVTRITPEAVVTLAAVIAPAGTQIAGNLPEDPTARRLFTESGFFDHVRAVSPKPTPKAGLILRRQSRLVEPETARDLVHFGLRAAGRAEAHHRACYRGLIECMSNTRDHAAGSSVAGTPPWYATVHGDSGTSLIRVGFADTGIGIFKSVRMRGIRRLYRAVGRYSNPRVLQEILEGRVESSTGHAYRGKGLPMIYLDCVQGRTKSLFIIANDVFADVARGVYRELPTKFHGTILYWEV